MAEPAGDARALVEHIAHALVDAHDQVFVELVEEDGATVVELEVAEDEMGKVIGRQGRTARSFRAVLSALGQKQAKRLQLEILE
jgi:predicted RNA-binding protein YlqC (UPF0109 family)